MSATLSTPPATGVRFAVRGSLAALDAADAELLLRRGQATDSDVVRATAEIIADVRARGDAALRDLARRFDAAVPERFEVSRAECDAALTALDAPLRAALEEAAASILAWHRAQLPPPLEVEVRPGVRLGRRAEPLARVGVYAPGGRAAYASSVLMGVLPARAAGVGEVVVCSPPGPDGRPPAAVLAACALAGADRVFALGGAGAVAALAYGTDSVPRVDKIVGPGNAYVTEAKRQLTGTVAIDCPAGPSEVLVIADDGADPEIAALELIAQAEHDPDACAVLVATCGAVAGAVAAAVERQLADAPRRAIIEAALAAAGAILVADSLDEALDFAERYAPEHLALLVREPRAALERVRAAGTVFLGPSSSVAFGDYLSGANHVLPTAGLARAYSGLSTLDFVRFATYQEISAEAAAALAAPTARLAEAEGLPGHAAAARARGVAGADEPAAGDPTVPQAMPAAAVPLRAAYRTLEPYAPDRRPVDVDLSDNTNLFGANPAAVRAVAALGSAQLTRYPSVSAAELRAALAARYGVAPDNVTTGCGLDDVIDSAVRAFCEPGDVLAYPDPTFGMVSLFARMNAVRAVPVPLGPGFALDADALLARRARLTYLCQPNNPTGHLFERAAIEGVAAGTGGVVLIDEAYADFADETDAAGEPVSFVQRAVRSERIVVLRTFSKAYGLAGLRVGYAIGPARLIREIEKSRGPYKVTAAADAAARAVLEEGADWHRGVIEETRRNRARLIDALQRLGYAPWPSAANFVLVPVDSAAGLAAALRARGVAMRAFADLPGIGDAVRISVGPWTLLERLLAALCEVLPLSPRGRGGRGVREPGGIDSNPAEST